MDQRSRNRQQRMKSYIINLSTFSSARARPPNSGVGVAGIPRIKYLTGNNKGVKIREFKIQKPKILEVKIREAKFWEVENVSKIDFLGICLPPSMNHILTFGLRRRRKLAVCPWPRQSRVSWKRAWSAEWAFPMFPSIHRVRPSSVRNFLFTETRMSGRNALFARMIERLDSLRDDFERIDFLCIAMSVRGGNSSFNFHLRLFLSPRNAASGSSWETLQPVGGNVRTFPSVQFRSSFETLNA